MPSTNLLYPFGTLRWFARGFVAAGGLLFLEILFKRSTDLRSRPVEEHALIGLRNAEEATGFLRRPPLDVAQDDDLTLTGGQSFNRFLKARMCFP